MLEAEVQGYFIRRVKRLHGWPIKADLLVKGFPDFIVFLPRRRMYLVELKRPGEKPSRVQAARHRMLLVLGFLVDVLDSKEAVDAWVERVQQ